MRRVCERLRADTPLLLSRHTPCVEMDGVHAVTQTRKHAYKHTHTHTHITLLAGNDAAVAKVSLRLSTAHGTLYHARGAVFGL